MYKIDGGKRRVAKKRKSPFIGASATGTGRVTRRPEAPRPRPSGDSPSDPGRRSPARPSAPRPHIAVQGDRPADRPDGNRKVARKVEAAQRKNRAESERRARAAALVELRKTARVIGDTRLERVRTKGEKVKDLLLGSDETPWVRDGGGVRERRLSDAVRDDVKPVKAHRAGDDAVTGTVLKILNETTRVARAVGEGGKAAARHGQPDALRGVGEDRGPGPLKAAAKAFVENKGDMPGDAVVPKDKKGLGWDALRLAGNVAGDPLSYAVFGAGTAARASAKAAGKKATKSARKQGATRKQANRAGRAAAKKVRESRPDNNRGISAGVRVSVPGMKAPIVDIKTSGRATAAASRAARLPKVADKVRAKASGTVRSMPGAQSVRPDGRGVTAHRGIRRAQRELRARQDAARREGAQVKRAIRKAAPDADGKTLYKRIESTPQGTSLGRDAVGDAARIARMNLGRAFDRKRAAGVADKPFRPRDMEQRVKPVVRVLTDKQGKEIGRQTRYRAEIREAGAAKWTDAGKFESRAEAQRAAVQAARDAADNAPARDARRFAPHIRQSQTEHRLPRPMDEAEGVAREQHERTVRLPLEQANAQAAGRGRVLRREDDTEVDLFTDDLPRAVGSHVKAAGESAAEARFWQQVSKTGKAIGQVAKVGPKGVLDLRSLPKGHMLYEVTPRGMKPLAGTAGELDEAMVRQALKDSGRDGRRFVAMDPAEVARIKERVFPDAGRFQKGDEAAAFYDRTQGKWKWAATVPNPGYHVRNLVGDSAQGWLGDANARAMADAARVISGRTRAARSNAKGVARKPMMVDLGKSGKITRDALLREAEDLGAIGLGQGGRELDELIHAGGKDSRMFDEGVLAGLSRLNMSREDLPRLASYIAARRRGLSPQEAADHTTRFHFDYGDLNKADRGFRRAVPFATFWTRNVPLQTVRLLERPGKYATLSKTLEQVAQTAGFEDYEAFAKDLNTWQQDGIPFPLRTPWDGELKTVNIGPPQTDLGFHRWVGMLEGAEGKAVATQMARDLISRLGPVKLLGELPLNYSTFFRGPIDPSESGRGSSLEPAPDLLGGWDAAPQAVRDMFGVVKFKDARDGKVKWGWDKQTGYGLRQLNPLLSRGIGTATPGSSERNQTPLDSLAGLLGANVSNYEQSVKKAAKSRQFDLRDKLRARKRYLEDTQKTKTPEYRKVTRDLKEVEKAVRGKKAKKRPSFYGGSTGGGGSFYGAGVSSGGEEPAVGGAPRAPVAPQVANSNPRQTQREDPEVAQSDQAPQQQNVRFASVRENVSQGTVRRAGSQALRLEARRAAEDAGLDPDFFEAQIDQESGFDPDAVSPAGATGVAQMMPGTARSWGVDARDPVASLREAARRMAGYVEKYGSKEVALAAYNAGEGAVAKHGGVPPFGETRQYIANIMGAAKALAREPAPGGGSGRMVRASADAQAEPDVEVSPERRARLATYFAAKNRSPAAIVELATDLSKIEASGDAGAASLARAAQRGTIRRKGAASGAAAAVRYAASKIGEAETDGPNRGRYPDWLNQRFGFRAAPWCAMFTSVAASQGGAPSGARSASVAEIRAKARAGDGYVKGVLRAQDARPGDLVLFGNDHIGLVESVDDRGIVMIAGNDSDRVQRRRVGFGGADVVRPRYAGAGR